MTNGLAVQEYIRENGFEALSRDLSIEAREYPEEALVVLNYNQFESPKIHPVVRECRGLILDAGNEYRVVARSFDRFFNLGEVPEETPSDLSGGIALEKIDGSLMTAYNFRGRWHAASRSMAFAEGRNTAGNSFAGVFGRALRLDRLSGYPEEFCLAFELVSPESRVITPYEADAVSLLAVRNRETGRELPLSDVRAIASDLGVPMPKEYPMGTLDDVLEAAKALPRLEEGYVCLFENPGGTNHRVKIKNPAYLVVKHLRGNGEVPLQKRIEMILSGEDAEFLVYFPEEERSFTPVRTFLAGLERDAETAFVSAPKENRKEFASVVKQTRFPWILFRMFDGVTAEQAIRENSLASLERLFRQSR